MQPTDNDKYGVNSIAEAAKWISVVTSVVGVMIVPALAGIWIDHLLGTKGLFAILGVVLGFVGGMYCLLDTVKSKPGAHESRFSNKDS
jgi:F0F1-type ATP synthase assembly protein I